MEISEATAVCCARHFAAAHESACTQKPVDWGGVCIGCSATEICKFDWVNTMRPVFEAADVHPDCFRPRPLQELQQQADM